MFLETFCHLGSLESIFFSVFLQNPDWVGLGQKKIIYKTLQGQQAWRKCLLMQEGGRGGSQLHPRAAQAPGAPSTLAQRFMGLPFPQDPTSASLNQP